MLASGGVLAIPTESSWGLAVDPRDASGVAAIRAIKGRAETAPMPVVAADVTQILALGVSPQDPALALGLHHWPAALSVVVGLAQPLPASSGRLDLAVRIPAHPSLRLFLASLGVALTATSANRSGTEPILEESALEALFAGRPGAVLGAGSSESLPGGLPSTLITFDPNGGITVLRAGRFPWPPQGSHGGSAAGDGKSESTSVESTSVDSTSEAWQP